MPILRFHAMEAANICAQSDALVSDLSQTVGCTADLVTLEIIESKFIVNGQETKGYPVIEVSWFDRGQAVQDATAKCITKHVQAMGYPEVDVIFMALTKSCYYENGEHF